ncbi:hypothetical protein VTI74DRAFT_4736 [Chaetomium olivicolor]
MLDYPGRLVARSSPHTLSHTAATRMSPNQQSHPCLLSIPAEILYLIYGGLDRRSLLQLARTCRMFHGLCIPLIYRAIEDRAATADTDTDMEDAAVTQQHSPARLKAFPLMLTLLGNPTVANQVEHIRFDYARLELPPIRDYRAILKRLFGIKMRSKNEARRSDAIKMALVCLSPSASTLEMTTSHMQHDTDFLLAKADLYSVPKPKFTLHHLTSITVRLKLKNYVNSTPANIDSIDISRLNGLLHCTLNLASLTIYYASGGSSLTAQLPCLTSLRLIDSFLEGEGLKALTASCRRLVHFELAYSIWSSLLPYSPSTAAEVLGCLAPSKDTLQRLRLQIRPRDKWRLMEVETVGAFPALRQLTFDDRVLARKAKSDDAALVRLIEGCPALEGLHLIGIKNLSAGELACFARAVESERW